MIKDKLVKLFRRAEKRRISRRDVVIKATIIIRQGVPRAGEGDTDECGCNDGSRDLRTVIYHTVKLCELPERHVRSDRPLENDKFPIVDGGGGSSRTAVVKLDPTL